MAELARFIDRFTIEYVRIYAHPIERLWRAITDPKEFRVWFIAGRLEAKPGGTFWFGDDGFTGTVSQVSPPRFIRFDQMYGGAPGYFQYELSEVAGGTRMRFVNHFPPEGVYAPVPGDLGGDLPGGPGTPWKPGFVGGFHEYWDALRDYLDGVPVGSRLPETDFNILSDAWTQKMERAGMFTDKQAARVALSLRRHERWNELNKIYREHIRAMCPPAENTQET
jgi:uncharacterized protein YndB with AHSA1/START domain